MQSSNQHYIRRDKSRKQLLQDAFFKQKVQEEEKVTVSRKQWLLLMREASMLHWMDKKKNGERHLKALFSGKDDFS